MQGVGQGEGEGEGHTYTSYHERYEAPGLGLHHLKDMEEGGDGEESDEHHRCRCGGVVVVEDERGLWFRPRHGWLRDEIQMYDLDLGRS